MMKINGWSKNHRRRLRRVILLRRMMFRLILMINLYLNGTSLMAKWSISCKSQKWRSRMRIKIKIRKRLKENNKK